MPLTDVDIGLVPQSTGLSDADIGLAPVQASSLPGQLGGIPSGLKIGLGDQLIAKLLPLLSAGQFTAERLSDPLNLVQNTVQGLGGPSLPRVVGTQLEQANLDAQAQRRNEIAQDQQQPTAFNRTMDKLNGAPSPGSVQEGLSRILPKLIDTITDPKMLVTLPALPESLVARALMGGQMAGGGVQSAQNVVAPGVSPSERVVSGADALLSALGVRALDSVGVAPTKPSGVRPDEVPNAPASAFNSTFNLGNAGADANNVMQDPRRMVEAPGLGDARRRAEDLQAQAIRLQRPDRQLPEVSQAVQERAAQRLSDAEIGLPPSRVFVGGPGERGVVENVHGAQGDIEKLGRPAGLIPEKSEVISKLEQRVQRLEQEKAAQEPRTRPADVSEGGMGGEPPVFERTSGPMGGLRPAVRVQGGEVIPGEVGGSHNDVIEKNGLQAKDIDSRVFVDENGQVLSREEAARRTGVSTTVEPGRLHSEDLVKADEQRKREGMGSEGDKPRWQGSSGAPSERYSGVPVNWDDVKKIVGIGEGNNWTHQGVKVLMNPQELGVKSSDTIMDAGQLKNRVVNKVGGENSSEAKLWKSLGIDDRFKAGEQTSPKQMAQWMQSVGPRVEVKKFGEFGDKAKNREARVEYGNLLHELETQPIQGLSRPELYLSRVAFLTRAEVNRERYYPGVTEEQVAKVKRMQELYDKFKDDESGTENQAHWSSIAPKAEKDMPGYTEIAVVKPVKVLKSVDKKSGRVYEEPYPPEFPSSHSFPPNTLGFVRGYMESDPKTGEKTFHVIEVQSDWAQKLREAKEARDTGIKNYRALPSFREDSVLHQSNLRAFEQDYQDTLNKQNDPLLPHYERLALKAAIDHARSEGATKIAVSDAETAMMSEGHDRATESSIKVTLENQALAEKIVTDKSLTKNNLHPFGLYAGDLYKVMTGQRLDTAYPEKWKALGFDVDEVVTQEKGMRLHYDRTLPKIAEELTGSKGERVEFGEHDQAVTHAAPDPVYRDTREEALAVPGRLNEPRSVGPGGWMVNVPHESTPRPDLIFKDANGQPKTSVTARSYSIAKPSARLSTGEPFSTLGVRYSGVPLPKDLMDHVKKLSTLLSGKFPPASSLPDKPRRVEPKTPTALETSLASARTTPLDSIEVNRAQPGEKLSALDSLRNSFNSKVNAAIKLDKVLLPIDALFDRLDGNKGEYSGWLFKNVRQPLDEAANYELTLRGQTVQPVTDLVKKYKFNTQNGERIGVYAHLQQKGGRERLLESGISPETLVKIERTITPQEKEVYNFMRANMDQTLPAIRSVMKELYGQDVELVENYFPMPRDYQKYRPEPSALAKGEFDEYGTWRMLQGDFEPVGAKTEQGFTITRKPGSKTAIKVDAFDIYHRHMVDVCHLLAMQKQLLNISKTVRRDMFKEKYGDMGQDMTLDWLNTVARQGKTGKQFAWLDALRNNTSKAIVGFRLASQVVHVANIPLAMQRAGVVNWSKGLSEVVGGQAEDFMQEHFKETYERGGGEPSVVDVSKGKVGGWAFALQRTVDRLNTQATVLGVYMGELEKKGLNPASFKELPYDKDAGARALVLARRAVASPLYKDIPPALARGGSLGKVFFQFQNTFLDQWSNIRHDFASAGIAQGNANLAFQMSVALSAMVMIESGIKFGAKQATLDATGNQPEGSDKYWQRVMEDALHRIPGVGQLMSEVMYGETGIPTVDVATGAVKGGIETVTGKKIQGYPNAKPSDKVREQGALKSLVSTAELAGVPGSSQVGEVAMDVMRANEPQGKQKKGKKRYSITQ